MILLIISVLSGVALLWVFSKTSNQKAIRETKKRLQARLLELRLYADDPKVVFRAQRALFGHNARYFLLMLRPAVFATIPMVVLLIALDAYYGKRPIAPGEESVVTVQWNGELPQSEPRLETPEGITVVTPAVRIPDEGQASWRIRADREVQGELVLSGGEVTKKIVAGAGVHNLMSRRVRSLVLWPLFFGESPISGDAIDWIEVEYPPAEVRMFGLETHWLVWWLVISMVTAFLLKGKFKVTI